MKPKPLKVNLKSILSFQKEYEDLYGKDYDPVAHIESILKTDKTYVKIGKRIIKINNIFNN